ncbi:hypothetical protein U1Q18_032306 [Sarracenia purpurea var. burkii]
MAGHGFLASLPYLLLACLNGTNIVRPEWMFSKRMRSAKISFSDNSVLRIIQIMLGTGGGNTFYSCELSCCSMAPFCYHSGVQAESCGAFAAAWCFLVPLCWSFEGMGSSSFGCIRRSRLGGRVCAAGLMCLGFATSS